MMADGQKGASDATTEKQLAANFVYTYFKVLHEKPALLHNFYDEYSILSVSYEDETASTSQQTYTGAQAAESFFQTFEFAGCNTQVVEVVFQPCSNRGLLVKTSGYHLAHDSKRKFVRTFLLEKTSEGKYFVRNDILLFFNAAVKTDSYEIPPTNTVAPAVKQEKAPVPQKKVEQTPAPVKATKEATEQPAEEVATTRKEAKPEPKQKQNVPREAKESTAKKEKSVPTKASWAKMASKSSDIPQPQIQPGPRYKKAPASKGKEEEIESPVEPTEPEASREMVNTAIYVSQLVPQAEDAQRAALKATFSPFGTIKNIFIKDSRDTQFAIVTFESIEQMNSVLERANAEKFLVNGVEVGVQERKMKPRGENRGSGRFENRGRGRGRGGMKPRPSNQGNRGARQE